MIKLTILNILGQPNGISDLKKGFDKTLKYTKNSRGVDEIKGLPISIDFEAQKHGVVTPVQYYISMVKQNRVSINLKVLRC